MKVTIKYPNKKLCTLFKTISALTKRTDLILEAFNKYLASDTIPLKLKKSDRSIAFARQPVKDPDKA
jgi:hypothetical protein